VSAPSRVRRPCPGRRLAGLPAARRAAWILGGGYEERLLVFGTVGVENRVAEEAAAYESEGRPNRLLNAQEVAKFVGCHEATMSLPI
jgi:hypothetical protein